MRRPIASREELQANVVTCAETDPRIVGLLDYGSHSEGRGDEWSDIDLEVFIRDDDFDAFERDWVAWAGGFGRLLLAFVGDIGNHWTVYDGVRKPIRADFALHRASEMPSLLDWPNAPLSVEHMVLVDKTDGALSALVARAVGRDLGPDDVPRRFELVCANFWYYADRTWSKLQRGPSWTVRFDIDFIMLGNLMALLRLEAGRVERWRASDAAANIERDISPERLARLDACIPGPAPADLAPALRRILHLGRDVSAAAAARYARPWPAELADRLVALAEQGTGDATVS
jgi:hypothetical protein